MEINLSPDTVKKWIAVLVLLVLAIGAFYAIQNGLLDDLAAIISGQHDIEQQEHPGMDAAITGIEAVFTLDYEESEEDWLARVCAVSTESGCTMAETWLAPSMTKIKTDAQAKTGSSADAIRLVDSGVETDGVADEEVTGYSWEVWEVALSFEAPWEDAEEIKNLFVQVSNEDGGWKFVRILFDEEAKKYAEETTDVQ